MALWEMRDLDGFHNKNRDMIKPFEIWGMFVSYVDDDVDSSFNITKNKLGI